MRRGRFQGNRKSYEVQKYAPGLLLLGADGGREAFAFDTTKSHDPIVSVPFVGLSRTLAKDMGSDFFAFLEELSGRPTE